MRWKKTLTLLPLLMAAAGSAAAAPPAGLPHRAVVHPLLEPLIAHKATAIPAELRSELAGGQGSARLDGREALSLFVRTTASRAELERIGVRVDTLTHGRATVTLLPAALPALAARADVSLVTLPHPLHPLLAKSVPETGVSVLRSQVAGDFTGATGSGVIVGVIDSGIDLDHPNFKDPAGNTRIRYLWDQTAPNVPGAPFGDGAECTAAQIDAHLCAEHDEIGAGGHGTHVTGIAAGNGAAPSEGGAAYAHVGMAPESDIVFVKLDFKDSNNAIKALHYIFDKADALGKPCVVNMSFGSHVGAHDGTDPLEQEIDDLVTAKPGRAVVVAAGNERGDDIHASVLAQAGIQVTGPVLTVPAYNAKPGSNNDYVRLTGYYAATDDVAALLITPTGSAHSFDLTPGNGCHPELDDVDGSIQVCNGTSSSIGQGTTAREIYVVIRDRLANKPPKNGAWRLYLTGDTVVGSGKVDFWVSGTMVSSFDLFTPPHFTTLADSASTICIPGTSRQAITVGSYNTRLCWTDSSNDSWSYTGTPKIGDVSPFSSAGPTRDGRQKPDLAAPGMGIVGPLADEVKASLLNDPNGAPFVINDSYRLEQGTSQAAPHVAGAVALLLEKEPGLPHAQIRSKLIGSTRQDPFTVATNAGYFATNPYFGFGKLDLGSWGLADPNETNDTPDQSTLVISGQLVDGYVDRAADVDFFRLPSAVAGDKLDVSLTSLPADYALAVLAQSAAATQCNPAAVTSKATSNQPGTANETIAYTTPAGQTAAQYVRVTSSAGAFSEADGYQIKTVITRPETAAVHNTTAAAQALPDFKEFKVNGGLSGGETDYYSFYAYPGNPVTLQAAGKTVEIRDGNNNLKASGFGSISWTVPTPGGIFLPFKSKYHAVVKGASGIYLLILKLQ